MFYEFLRVTLSWPIRSLWLKKVYGLENVPKAGGTILASNHESYLDFLLVPVSGCRLPCYMVGEVFFEMPLISSAFRSMGFIPVDRRRVNTNARAIRLALDKLRAGGVLGIFPEGTRSHNGMLQRAYNGVALLAHMSEVPVVPVAVSGTYEAWPKRSKWPRAHACEVRFGEPLEFKKVDYLLDKDILPATTEKIMTHIATLAGEEYRW